MLQTYRGACHCGAVRFEADLDLSQPTYRCNCTWCTKTRMWKAFAYGDGLRIIAGASNLGDYRASDSNWPEGTIHHWFCKTCGVRGFSKGYLEMPPFNGWFHAVNVATLELTPEALAAIPVVYEDGAHDIYDQPPPVTSYL